jgi:D-inositol-3-phosphate glycosyltransferase
MNLLVPHGFEPNYTLGFAKALAANGVRLLVLSSDDSAEKLTLAGIQNTNIRGSQRNARNFGVKIRGLIVYYCRVLLHLFRYRGGTIHFSGIFRNEFIIFEGTILHLAMRMAARRYIYTAHNILPHNRQESIVFTSIYKYIYKIPDIIVVHTETARSALMDRFHVSADKIRVVAIGLNEEVPVTSMSRDDARARLDYNKDTKLILFFGRVDEYKGLHLLIEAFSTLRLPDSRLLVAGEIRSEEYAGRVIAQVHASHRSQDIRLDFRMIPNDEVEILFKAADVLCLPYLNITQSGLIPLAARFGIPVIATNVGSMATLVKRETGLITKSNDATGIAAALLQIFASMNEYKCERIQEIGRKNTWDRSCVELIPLYEQPMAIS